MKTTHILSAAGLAAAIAIAAAPAVAGTPSQMTELRGYNTCLDAHEKSFNGLKAPRTYLLSNGGSSRTYYINATAWEKGERVPVGITCDITRDGRELLSSSVTPVRFAAGEIASEVQVAGQ